MSNFIIQTIQPDEVLRISTCVKNVEVSDVFTATLLCKGVDTPVYLKNYSLEEGERALLNEIIGYLVCNTYGIPQPQQAFFVLVPKYKVLPFLKGVTQRFRDSIEHTDVFPMFATQRLNGKDLAFRYNHSMELVIAQLKHWRHYKSALICDEILANTDRLPRNILYLGDKEF